MDKIFRLNTDLPTPAPGVKVLKAAHCQLMLDSTEIINAAYAQAKAIEQRAQQAYEERYSQGYEDGLEAGKLENSEKMMETVLASVEFIENIEHTVIRVVNDSIRKIIGELDDETRITSIVRTALKNVRGQHKVTVRVCPKDETIVTNALSAMSANSYLTVIADSRLEPNSCMIESELGIVDASLETQLKALEHAFSSKLKE